METTSAPAAPASAPAASSTPTTSSTPSTSGQPTRKTTAELSQTLFEKNSSPSTESQEAAPEISSESPWHETYKDVHGIPVQELLESISNGQLPEALYDKLRFNLQDGDYSYENNLNELRDGAMMRDKFTKKTQALADERKAFYGERDEFVGYLKGWKENPEQFVYGAQRLGLPILQAAEFLAKQLTTADAMNAAAPGTGDQWIQAMWQKAELEDLRRAQESQQQRQAQSQSQQKDEATRQKLQTTSKEIFNKIGLKLEESSWTLYTQHVQAIYDDKPEGRKSLTKSDLEKAAQRTQSQLKEYAQRYFSANPKKEEPGAKLGAIPLDPGAPKGVPDRAPKKAAAKTTADFEQQLRERAGIRQR